MNMRFLVERVGASWRILDTHMRVRTGFYPYSWHATEQQAIEEAGRLNKQRPDGSREPKCCRCGRQPAGPAGSETPMCGTCHSRLANMHG